MSAYKILAGVGTALLVGATVVAPVFGVTIIPGTTEVKNFLKGLIVDGQPKVNIVVGSNGALASDAMVAGWISAKLATQTFKVETTTKNITITPEEIKHNITTKVSNKKVKLTIGLYTTEYNESFTVKPNETIDMNFTVKELEPIVVGKIAYNLTVYLNDTSLGYDVVKNQRYVKVNPDKLMYVYEFVNTTEKGSNLNITELEGQTIYLFGKKFKVNSINWSKKELTIIETSATETIQTGEELDLTKFGAPYKIKLIDIVENWSTNNVGKGVYVQVIDAKTNRILEEITDTAENVANKINTDYLDNYSIKIDIVKVVKSGTQPIGYMKVEVIKNEFTLNINGNVFDVPDDLAKVLKLETGKWKYKFADLTTKPKIEFIYKDELQLYPSEEKQKLPGGLELYVTETKPTTMYTAQLIAGDVENIVTKWDTKVTKKTANVDKLATVLENKIKSLGFTDVIVTNETDAKSPPYTNYLVVKTTDGKILLKEKIYDVDSSGAVTWYNINKAAVNGSIGIYLNLNTAGKNFTVEELRLVDFEDVKNTMLAGFSTINDTETWDVQYNYGTNKDNDFVMTIKIVNGSNYVKIVYNITDKVIAVYDTDNNLRIPFNYPGEAYLDDIAVYIQKPELRKLELQVPDRIPELKVSKEAKHVLKETTTTTLGEGESTTVGNTMIKVDAISQDVDVAVQGITVQVNTQKVTKVNLSVDELVNLVVTDEEWYKLADKGKAEPNVIAVGSEMVNVLVENIVCGQNLQMPYTVPCREGKPENGPCTCKAGLSPNKYVGAGIVLTNYEYNGKTYKVLIVAGAKAEDTIEAAKKLLQLMDEIYG